MRVRFTVVLAGAIALGLIGGMATRSDAASSANFGDQQTIATLRVGLGLPISRLDVARPGGAAWVLGLGVESLMKMGPAGRPQPHLATSVTQPTPVTYIYTLRKGVRFWNGNELTAEDVANALNYYRHPTHASVGFFYTSVKTVKATGRYTVKVTLKRRDASWQSTLAQYGSAIFEKKFADQHGAAFGDPSVGTMGTGPWKFDRLDPTRGIELSANDRYWGGRPRIRRISYRFFANETSMALALRAGEIDVALNVSAARAFEATSNSNVLTAPGTGIGYFVMPTKTAPWNDVRVRRAVAYALNRADILQATATNVTPITTIIPPTLLMSLGSKKAVSAVLGSLRKYPHNIALARRELSQSSRPSGFSATLGAFTSGRVPEVSQVIVAQLKEIGIDLTIRSIPISQFTPTFRAPRDEFPPMFFTTGQSRDPATLPNLLLGSKNVRPGYFNSANYSPAAVDELIEAGAKSFSPAERLAAYAKLLRRLATDLPYIPLYAQNSNAGISSEFAWPGFNDAWLSGGPWAQQIRPR